MLWLEVLAVKEKVKDTGQQKESNDHTVAYEIERAFTE